MTRLSVNINKVATIRNSRGGNMPNLRQVALDCESFGAEGITVHPRPDERHIRYSDVREIRPLLRTEFNMEGNPTGSFLALACEVVPNQVTLVPDAPDAITSNAGWDTVRNYSFLSRTVESLKSRGIRTSIFIEPDPRMVEGAVRCGADRVEMYTAAYAEQFRDDPEKAIAPYLTTAKAALELGIGLNAGHDLNRENLGYFISTIPWVDEVSIGHALISDALYLGLEKTISEYLECIRKI